MSKTPFLGFWGIYWSQSRVNLLNHTYSWSACRDLSTGVWYDHFNKDSHEISLKKWSKSEVHAKACTGRIAHPTEMRVSDSYSARSITPENISKTWIALFLFTGMEGVKFRKVRILKKSFTVPLLYSFYTNIFFLIILYFKHLLNKNIRSKYPF